jgi:hypothetical protein
VAAKSAEVQQSLCIAELEEANTRLHMELAVAHTKVAEVEKDFGLATIVNENFGGIPSIDMDGDDHSVFVGERS